MGLIVVTPPTDYPVTLDEAKAQCRVTHDDEDTLLSGYIAAATAYAEKQIGMSLMARTYALKLDAFASQIELPRGPVTSVTSVEYIGDDGLPVEVDSEFYTVDTSSKPQWVVLNSGYSWPTPMTGINMVTVTYVAGVDEVPDDLTDVKHAVMLLIGHWYNQRESVSADTVKEVPLAVDALLQNYRWIIA